MTKPEWIWEVEYCWGNYCNEVFYGMASWPSYSYWIVPGTIRE